MPNEADFYTPGEVAKMLGLAELTVLDLLTSGQLEGHQDERARWWIPPAAVDAARRSSTADNAVGPLSEQTIPITPVTPTNGGALPASEETTQLEAGAGTVRPARRTSSRESDGQSTSESGWTTTDQAARALGVSPRTVRRFIDRGELEGRKVTEGIVEAWEVSIDSLYALRDKRISEGQVRRNVPRKSTEGQSSSDNDMDYVRELTDRLLRISSEAAELRTRLELTFKAESTLQEERDRLRQDWERERQERQEAQEEAQRLREELVAERSKGFWRRLFGG
jgi:excisionase family DNA binding protein